MHRTKRFSALCGLLILSLAAAVPAQATEVDFNLNADAARLSFSTPLPSRPVQVGGGWLHEQNKGDVLHADAHVIGLASSGRNPIRAGVGGRLVGLDAKRGRSGGAFSIGGFFRYQLPTNNRIGFAGHLYFAPDLLSFSRVEEYFDVAASASYDLLREADVYVGYRKVAADFRGSSFTFDSAWHVGIRLSF